MRSTTLIGNRVRLARIEQGMSPEQFGQKFGVSGMTIRRLEDGRQKRLTARSMMLIAKGCHVPVGELFEI
jgi:transcriptional regulator with XRE-family HTH domain